MRRNTSIGCWYQACYLHASALVLCSDHAAQHAARVFGATTRSIGAPSVRNMDPSKDIHKGCPYGRLARVIQFIESHHIHHVSSIMHFLQPSS